MNDLLFFLCAVFRMNQGLTINIDPHDAYDSNLPDLKNGTFTQRLVWFLHWLFVYIPVIICYFIISSIYLIYISTYLWFLIFDYDTDTYASSEVWFFNSKNEQEKESSKFNGVVQFILCNIWLLFLLISSIKAVKTNPGGIPDSNGWKLERDFKQGQGESVLSPNTDLDQIEVDEITPELIPFVERKKEGGPRTCEHCLKIKPDRCHHCKLCDVCVLKMDHHCPWINNCVGFYNYKYFILTVFYGLISTFQIVLTYWEAVYVWLSQPNLSNSYCFWIFFYYSMTCKLCILLFIFFGFHMYLLYNCITTIEYCEKIRSKEHEKFIESPYKVSFKESFLQIFGTNIFCWFLPISINTQGKGILWKVHLQSLSRKISQQNQNKINQADALVIEESEDEYQSINQTEQKIEQERSIIFERVQESEESLTDGAN